MTTTAPAQSTAKRMSIGSVKRAAPTKTFRVLLYGTEGVGKSTFAAGAPAPVFIAPSKAIEQLGVDAFPQPTSAREIREAIAELENGKHDYRTLVIDELGWVEQTIWTQVCAAEGVASIEKFEFGRGYAAAFEIWRTILADLERLQTKRGMHVVLLGHAEVKRFNDPQLGAEYDRFRVLLHEKSSGLLRQWVAAVLFARYELHSQGKREKNRALSDGSRVIHCEWSPAFDAKNRYGLPATLPLSWEEFAAAASGGSTDEATAAIARIAELRASLAGHLDEGKFAAALKAAGTDRRELVKLADMLETKAARIASPTTATT